MSELPSKVTIINLTPWPQGFSRINTNGSVNLPAYGRMNIEREEIASQCYDRNVQFVGIDGYGSHARIYIDDEELRKQFEFEGDGKKQNILSDEKLERLFTYKRMSDFERALGELVKIHAEKFVLLDYIKRNKINDYEKIRAVEKLVGIPVDQ